MNNAKKATIAVLTCALVLCLAIGVIVTPNVSHAAANYTANWGTHELVQQSDYNLRDGAKESQFISYGPSYGSEIWFSRSVANVYDLNKVTVLSSYKGYDTLLKQGVYSTSTVADQVNFVTTEYGWDVIGAVNGTSFDTGNGRPTVGLMINGVQYSDTAYPCGFFGIMLDSNGKQKAVIGEPSEVGTFFNHKRGEALTRSEWNGTAMVDVDYTDYEMKHATGGWGYSEHGAMLVRNSEVVSQSADDAHPRTAIGIKADGSVVTYVCEGRNNGRAAGMNLATVAGIMKDLGCVFAINLDGGGSSTALSRHEGETNYQNRIVAAYGADRSVSDAILFVATDSYEANAKPDHGNTFARAQVLPNNDLFISGTKVQFSATGSNAYGDPVALPDGLTWKLDEEKSTPNIGTIDATTGLFSATTTVGNAVINLCQGENVVGTTKVSFSWPGWNYYQNWVKEFSLGLNETKDLYMILYPAADATNAAAGISTWRPFVLQEGDIDWNLPEGCRIEIVNSFPVFHSGNKVVSGATVSMAKINGTGQTSGAAFNNLVATVDIGKPSLVVYDFEDEDWRADIGQGGTGTSLYQTSVAEGGKVLFGEHAMAIDYDFSDRNYIPNIEAGKANNPTVTWYNDNLGFNPIVPADAKYFGFWMWMPEGFEGCWLRVTFEGTKDDGSKGTNRTIMTDMTDGIDQGTKGDGHWRFYYGQMGYDISQNLNWSIKGPFSIYSAQIMWSAFADTALGYNYNHAESEEGKEAARLVIKEKFDKASKGTLYIDNVIALYSEPSKNMVAPYISDMSFENGEESSTVSFTLKGEERYNPDEMVAIKYGEPTKLSEMVTFAALKKDSVEIFLNDVKLEAGKIAYNDTTGLMTLTLPVLKSGDKLRVVAANEYENKIDKTFTFGTLKFVEKPAEGAEGDSVVISEKFILEGSPIELPQYEGHTIVNVVKLKEGVWTATTLPKFASPNETVYLDCTVNKYNLTIKIDGEQVGETTAVDYGSAITLPTAKTGYTLTWNNAVETMPAKDLVIEGVYTVNKYNLTFKIDGEQVGETTSVAYGSAITLPTAKTGYTLTWDNAVETMPANDLVITGSYTVNKYNLTIKVDGKQVGETTSVAYGSAITLPTMEAKTGYTFAWANAVETMPANDLVINGAYTANKYKLTIKVDGVQVGETISVDYDSAITLPEAKTGYKLTWENAVDKMPAQDLVITGSHSVDTTYLAGKVSAIESAKTVEEKFAAIKAADAAVAIYTKAELDGMSESVTKLNTLKQAYTTTSTQAAEDLTVSEKVVDAMLSVLVEAALAAVATFIIKRRIF